ncbi:MAG: peroxide stress protein YaaA [Gammaproteobacteria bacterium]|nr:MAG: peroxide stress protein YaaA [Gammaproteobacteria bacterium]RLA15338.1 MAG: peroxide stress protein YaaA [Gammaproteobacteria bacterium]RLA17713.1 MAG: peroxide stress protein YaaA [Gammaproteobacteria bacterium]
MIIVLSPAKSLDFETPAEHLPSTQPDYIDQSEELIGQLRKLDSREIAGLMSISEKLAELNHRRYQAWRPEFTIENSKQALLAFTGDVYQGLDAGSFSDSDLQFAQQHLRILSGLYGLLKPLDLMQPYRLEMGTGFANKKGKNLYEFWGDQLASELNRLLETEKVLVNLASNEYFKAVKAKQITGEIITPQFKDLKNGHYKIISFFAKRARGAMARYIIENRLDKPEQLKEFAWQGYRFDADQSRDNDWVFSRDAAPA